MRLKTPESGVLRACLDLLAAERIWHERRNTGALRDGKRFVKFSRNGTADIQATFFHTETYLPPQVAERINVVYLVVLWIECKSDSGKQSEAQKAFQTEVEAAGHYYLVVRKPEDLMDWLREHGATRQR